MNKEMPLMDKVAVVTGSRGGIGKGIALAFAEAGADVALCDIMWNDGEMGNTADEIKKAGHRSYVTTKDVSQKVDVDALVEEVIQEFGRIDVLVNNAAVMVRVPLVDLSEDEWIRMIDINLKGVFFCCQAVGKRMMESKSGCIINIGSSMGIRAGMNRGAYSVSKAGVLMMTKVLAGELASYNIRVNAISPHLIKTEFSRPVWSDPKALKEVMQGVPLGYPGEVFDVGNVAVFLASEASRYVTGHNIAVDGGWLI